MKAYKRKDFHYKWKGKVRQQKLVQLGKYASDAENIEPRKWLKEYLSQIKILG